MQTRCVDLSQTFLYKANVLLELRTFKLLILHSFIDHAEDALFHVGERFVDFDGEMALVLSNLVGSQFAVRFSTRIMSWHELRLKLLYPAIQALSVNSGHGTSHRTLRQGSSSFQCVDTLYNFIKPIVDTLDRLFNIL